MEKELIWQIGVLGVLAVVTAVEHLVLARRLKEYELVRRGIGIVTVLGAGLPLALMGIISIECWIFFLVAFGVAGAVTIGLYIWEAVGAGEAEAWKVAGERLREIGGKDGEA
jgi:hypothetical protein